MVSPSAVRWAGVRGVVGRGKDVVHGDGRRAADVEQRFVGVVEAVDGLAVAVRLSADGDGGSRGTWGEGELCGEVRELKRLFARAVSGLAGLGWGWRRAARPCASIEMGGRV